MEPFAAIVQAEPPFEVASRGFSFVISFSKALGLHEVWHSVECPFSMLFGNSVGLS